jgi:hypothetical protein
MWRELANRASSCDRHNKTAIFVNADEMPDEPDVRNARGIDSSMMHRQGRMHRMRQLVDTLVAEPPDKPWHDLLAPFLVSIALVAAALLLSAVQMLFDV